MSSLANKYRPSSFNDLSGQLQTARALKNALEYNRINHAYLFFGSRGIGKTSVARILAKSLNCQKNGVSIKPCGECDNCREITEGRSIDVIEMDAASNRGIEHIRDLRENVRFAPMKSRYKIYIIDEVHMLTNESFNALLKTLEEPPEHVVFIMATTEFHKIPETILSRCQAFPFKKFSNHEIRERLEFILGNEKIEYEKESLIPLAIKGEGSMRDSISLLDRIIAYSGEQKITYELVNEVLGIIPSQLYLDFLGGVIARDLKKCLEQINSLYYNGYNLKVFFFDFLSFLKNCLMIKKGLYKDSGYFTQSQQTDIENKIGGLDEEELILTFEICYKLHNNWTYYNTTNSFEILLNVEMAILEILNRLGKPSVSALLQKLSRLENALSEGKPFVDNVAENQAAKNQAENKSPVSKEADKTPAAAPAKPSSENNEPASEENDISLLIQREFGAREEDEAIHRQIFNKDRDNS